MQLKSLFTILKTYFWRLFIFPLMLLFCFMLLALLVINVKVKRNEDVAYVETIKTPLINTILLYQPQEAQMLLSSISVFRGWTKSYLVSRENLIINSHPHVNSNSIGRPVDSECKTFIDLIQRNKRVGKICYVRNNWAFLDYTMIAVLICGIVALLLISFFYKKLILKINLIFNRLTRAVKLLENSTFEDHETEFVEEEKILRALKDKVKLLNEIKNKEIERVESVARMQLAEQVSHDIRSPLEALHNLSISNCNIPNIDRRILESSIKRISDIANNLLHANDYQYSLYKASGYVENVGELIESVLLEKRMEFKDLTKVKINFENNVNEKICVGFQDSELLRILSNLVNNSFESINSLGEINLILKKVSNKYISIIIKDTGKGMSQEVLSNLGKRGFTGKEKGNGLGMYHAKSTVESFGGSLTVESKLEQGTIVSINLPIIEINNNEFIYDYVYIDNDELCRLVWKSTAEKKGVKLLLLSSTIELTKYVSKIDKNITQIYIDSDLGEDSIKGEDFAYELHMNGFKSLFIATGYSADHFKHLNWLNYSTKKCPF